jgi:hypothetical protein
MADEIRHLKVKSPPADLHIARIAPVGLLSHSRGLIANATALERDGWPFDGRLLPGSFSPEGAPLILFVLRRPNRDKTPPPRAHLRDALKFHQTIKPSHLSSVGLLLDVSTDIPLAH